MSETTIITSTQINITKQLEDELNQIRSSEVKDMDINMSELDEISSKIIEAKSKLEAYAVKHDSGIKKVMSTIPLIKYMVKSTQEIIDQNKTIGEVLNTMISYFDKKYDVIINKVSSLEDLSIKINSDIEALSSWILKSEEIKKEIDSKADILRIDKLITVAKMELILKQDTVMNKINPSIQASIYLAENINTLSPILRGTLQEELSITASLNTFKDASVMLVELKDLVVTLKKINNVKVEDIVISTLDNASDSLFTTKELEDLLKMSQQSQNNMIKHAQAISKLTVDNIEKVKNLESKVSNQYKESNLLLKEGI